MPSRRTTTNFLKTIATASTNCVLGCTPLREGRGAPTPVPKPRNPGSPPPTRGGAARTRTSTIELARANGRATERHWLLPRGRPRQYAAPSWYRPERATSGVRSCVRGIIDRGTDPRTDMKTVLAPCSLTTLQLCCGRPTARRFIRRTAHLEPPRRTNTNFLRTIALRQHQLRVRVHAAA